jgi:branched-chain amino acid transport system substrate-binding protein
MMKKTIRKIFVCCFGVLLSVSLLTTPATSVEPVVKEWKVPFLAFLTGPFAGFGLQIKWAADEAAKEINAAGGIAGRPIVIEYYDTALDPAKAAAEMSKVVGELLIFGPISGPETKGAMPLVVREKGFAMAVTSGAEVNLEFHPYCISFEPTFGEAIPLLLKGWVKRNPEMKSVVQFSWPYDSTFMVATEVEKKALEALGIKVKEKVELVQGVDMAAAAVRAMAAKPDGFVITAGPVDSANIVKELDKRGMKDKSKIFLYCVADESALYDIAKGYLEGAYVWNLVNSLSKEPRWQALYSKFRKAFPKIKDPTLGVPGHYDMVYMAKEAIEKNGITGDPAKRVEERARIREYMQNIKDFPGVQFRFNMVDGTAKTPVFLFRIKGNEKELVETCMTN